MSYDVELFISAVSHLGVSEWTPYDTVRMLRSCVEPLQLSVRVEGRDVTLFNRGVKLVEFTVGQDVDSVDDGVRQVTGARPVEGLES